MQALIEENDGSPEVLRAIERGEAWLMDELPKVRRDDPMLIYNVWSHGYGIQALVAMHGRVPDDAARRERIAGLIRGQFEKLVRYESAEGGWGYYDFGAGTQRPNSSSQSFVNAAVLVETSLAPRALLEGLLAIEALLGRARSTTRWIARPIDLDIVLFGNAVVSDGDLQIPHPRFRERAFVLLPLAEIAANARDPVTGETVESLLRACPGRADAVRVGPLVERRA